MIVDDDKESLINMKEILSAEGYKVSVIKSGTEALDKLGGE